MKALIVNKENPNGIIVEVEDEVVVEEAPEGENDPIKAFFEGLASSDTNSIAKIRSLAKVFLENTSEGEG